METLTVNLQLQIPIQRDSLGRRIGITKLVYAALENLGGCSGEIVELPEYDQEIHSDVYQRMLNLLEEEKVSG